MTSCATTVVSYRIVSDFSPGDGYDGLRRDKVTSTYAQLSKIVSYHIVLDIVLCRYTFSVLMNILHLLAQKLAVWCELESVQSNQEDT